MYGYIQQRSSKMASKKWHTQKSFWAGITAIIGGVAGIATKTVDIATGVQTIIGGFAIIFLRDAINK